MSNFQANPGGGGDTFAADEIANVKYPRSKIGFGSDGAYVDVDETNRLPVINPGASALNVQFQEDETATTVRSITEERLIAEGLYNGRYIVSKFGRDGDIDTATTPEDVWAGGGIYAGFPTGAAEELQAFSSSASDTGLLTVTYLPSFTATAWLTTTVTLTGTTPVNLGVTAVRAHTAYYNSQNATTFNVGDITIRHRTTTANLFLIVPAGKSQTNNSAYTIPFGSRGFIKRFVVREVSNVTGFVEGALWLREYGKSPRLRRPFAASAQSPFEEIIYGGLELPALTDITVRILTASANNMAITAGYDLIVVPS